MLDHNKVFHTIIIDTCGNSRIKNMVRWVENIPLQFRSFYCYSTEAKIISDCYHRSVFKALSTREANRAQAMMQEHLYHARDLLLERIHQVLKSGGWERMPMTRAPDSAKTRRTASNFQTLNQKKDFSCLRTRFSCLTILYNHCIN